MGTNENDVGAMRCRKGSCTSSECSALCATASSCSRGTRQSFFPPADDRSAPAPSGVCQAPSDRIARKRRAENGAARAGSRAREFQCAGILPRNGARIDVSRVRHQASANAVVFSCICDCFGRKESTCVRNSPDHLDKSGRQQLEDESWRASMRLISGLDGLSFDLARRCRSAVLVPDLPLCRRTGSRPALKFLACSS